MLTIRKAELTDLDSITEIYNEAVLTTTATFDTETKTVEERKEWFEHHDSKHPVIAAELDGRLVGWASLSKWSERLAYAGTAEISLYVKEEFRGRGIGRKLLEAAIQEGQEARIHTVLARIAEGNELSVKLHESVGFRLVGVMKQVGFKFGKLLDVYLMQKVYEN